jgi:hypothetical protein
MRKLTTLALLFSVNCGTIIHQTTQTIPVTSEPAGAAVTVACGEVENAPNLTTPTKVEVHRKPDFCVISLEKEGYAREDVRLEKTLSALYLGNILVGGIIGFIVDGVNGAMWNRKPGKVDVILKPAEAPAAPTQ